MSISIIVAVAENYAIGLNNKIPWHLPSDFKYFKEITTGHTVVMGLNTFRSLPNGALPNRRNIVVSFEEVDCEGCTVVYSLQEAMELCKNEDKVFIIGGASIYRQTIDVVDSLYITWVHEKFEADTFFPEIDPAKWKEIERVKCEKDEKNCYDYSFVKYERIENIL
jgi:Dihydrofolate reductase